jgi:hypothetical protein
MTRWRIRATLPQLDDDAWVELDATGWWYVGNPYAATTWPSWHNAKEIADMCPCKDAVVVVEAAE